ncbi:PREDICTED: uncharacterized protein LOC105447802 [Wasmannia auropunctata]|uniref:uncharacterized protein LOC105447802 n=1 Tax=Wasmannia auropunctata TaxID=64793 RepID=UPI0005EF47E1|nr:PREDICTED: uncharacterized protein LOC105447802 [Wasmannia auropunctata]
MKDLSKINFRENQGEIGKDDSEEDEIMFAMLATINRDPISYSEAMASTEQREWTAAINEELQSMKDNHVWKIVPRPKSSKDGKRPNIIDSKWVFKRKTSDDGGIKYKGRLVIKGFKDTNVYELKETYAPVSRLPVVRAVLAIINKYNLETIQMDVKTAFLNGTIEDEMYMEIPEGLKCTDEEQQGWSFCYYCNKMAQHKGPNCPKRTSDGAGNSKSKTNVLKNKNSEAKGKSEKEAKGYPEGAKGGGVGKSKKAQNSKKLNRFKKDNRSQQEKDRAWTNTLKLGQAKITEFELKTRLERMDEYWSRFQEQNFKLVAFEEIEETNYYKDDVFSNSEESYLSNRAKFLTAMSNLAPKIAKVEPADASATPLIKQMQLPKMSLPKFSGDHLAWESFRDLFRSLRLLRYLRGTSELGLTFRGNSDHLDAMTDASFRDHLDSTSTGGYVIRLFGDPVSWRSYKQSYVTLSTCQSEYLAMSNACQEIISLDKAIRDIVGKTFYPVQIWCDNKAAGDCTEKDGSHKLKNFDEPVNQIKEYLEERERSGVKKHMADTHGDYIKSCVSEGKFNISWIATKENLADIMTKALARESNSQDESQKRKGYIQSRVQMTHNQDCSEETSYQSEYLSYLRDILVKVLYIEPQSFGLT